MAEFKDLYDNSELKIDPPLSFSDLSSLEK